MNCFFSRNLSRSPLVLFRFLFEVNLTKLIFETLQHETDLHILQNRNKCLDIKNKPFDWLNLETTQHNQHFTDHISRSTQLFMFPKMKGCWNKWEGAGKKKQEGRAPSHFGLARTLSPIGDQCMHHWKKCLSSCSPAVCAIEKQYYWIGSSDKLTWNESDICRYK